ncbi:hypothetical protein F8C76_10535 [Flagellimonas olearia]|uniref:Uncharacterized protein n=1 Tax=Flagellimonas olearia TaxID=552546 RepID=A0A6I1DUA4_9FLAO|nr:hypothetical protein [Allomuricauda olearia]KAB7528298.1 hypothetical protein F8C76_10535 [Allomuricauda olearia]
MIRISFILAFCALQACAQRTYYGQLEWLGEFPSKLTEVSGLETNSHGDIWVVQDSGNKDEIYKVDSTAQILETYKIDHAKNKDWEDLAMDLQGNLYIGDFGNNSNERKDLTIYKVSHAQLDKKEPNAKKIRFNYPEQKRFPPKKNKLLFDTEGFFHWQGFLYIFTKNRTRPYTGETLVYRVPDTEGDYDAEFLGSLFLCMDQDHCSVTGADISPDGKSIALLTYGFVFLLTDFDFHDLSKAQSKTIDLNCDTQIESIGFLDNGTLLLADEERKKTGRNLYRLRLK